MNDDLIHKIDETVKEVHDSIMSKPLEVLSIFNDFFEDTRVDMQEYYSLEELKTYLHKTPISSYLTAEQCNISSCDWNSYKCYDLYSISELVIPKILDGLIHNITNLAEAVCTPFILVHFPTVRITNEHDRFVDIKNLWAKIQITWKGNLYHKFLLNRSEYSLLHFASGYMHSHVNIIPKGNFQEFQSPCTGSGPINNTMNSLHSPHLFNRDLWRLFCLELSKYVTVESISGTPYHYLERLGTSNMTQISDFTPVTYMYTVPNIPKECLKDFIKYFIKSKVLKFNYINGCYSAGMTLSEYMIAISNQFINWYNQEYNKYLELNKKDTSIKKLPRYKELLENHFLNKGIICKGRIYFKNYLETNYNHYEHYIGRKVCTFKGKDILLSITELEDINTEKNESVLINITFALLVLTNILKTLNYRYGRDNKNETTKGGNSYDVKVRYA